MKRLAILVCLAVTLAVSSASAEGSYIGASWLSTNAEFETAVENFDIDDSGWKIFAGHDPARFFGAEISFRDLGDFSETVGTSRLESEVEAWEISLRGVLPIGRFLGIFGKIGYAYISVDGSFEAENIDRTPFSDSSWELMYGLGLHVNLGKSFGLRAEWEQFDTRDSLNAFSAGAFFRF